MRTPPRSPAKLAAWTTVCLVAVPGLLSCAKASEESAARRSPIGEPPPSVEIAETLSIPVEVDGKAIGPITRARLTAIAPDFADAERKAWRLTRVLGDTYPPGSTLEAVGRGGVAIAVERPQDENDAEPVLYLTRRGDVAAAVVTPDNPFPGYHGQGGRLRRPGDPMPRTTPVVELRIRTH